MYKESPEDWLLKSKVKLFYKILTLWSRNFLNRPAKKILIKGEGKSWQAREENL